MTAVVWLFKSGQTNFASPIPARSASMCRRPLSAAYPTREMSHSLRCSTLSTSVSARAAVCRASVPSGKNRAGRSRKSWRALIRTAQHCCCRLPPIKRRQKVAAKSGGKSSSISEKRKNDILQYLTDTPEASST